MTDDNNIFNLHIYIPDLSLETLFIVLFVQENNFTIIT